VSAGRHGLPPLLSVFGDESGSFHSGDWQVIGVVFTTSPAADRAALAALRRTYAYTRELKFSSTDITSLPFGLAVIDWFVNAPNVSFRYIAKRGDDIDLAHWRGRIPGLAPEEAFYNYTYMEVLRHNLPASHRALITVDQQSRTKGNNLLTYLKTAAPTVRDVVDGDSKLDDLLQVADLLTGCVYGNLTGTTQGRKRSLTDTLMRSCGMKSAADRYPKIGRDKVNAWIWKGKK
jgi:Protein of unknown function (DUF3800)